MIRYLLTAFILMNALAASAGELILHSRVVDVQPLTQQERLTKEVGDCAPAKPAAGDLVALLVWDLRADCRVVMETRETVTGYRVVHVVDGRRLERIVDERPGKTIPVRLTLH